MNDPVANPLGDKKRFEHDDDDLSRNDSPEEAFRVPWYILACIVYAQFAGTSLWFAGNAVLSDFSDELDLPESALEILTSAVQAGFIAGTLILAITNLVDRFLPTHIFFASALVGAGMNALIPTLADGIAGMTVLRFLTGTTLAGIYPVGMKIAADWYQDGLGRALGLLVGALVVGTAFPFLLQQIPQSWELLLYETSAIAASGGLLMVLAVPNGPYRKPSLKGFDPTITVSLFRSPEFTSAACGYFGHMFELYAFWAWCPVVWDAYLERNQSSWDASVVTFAVIAVGGLGCVVGGLLSPRVGSGRVALVALGISGSCCLLSPLFYFVSIPEITLVFYLLWGVAVAADSPQFSSLVAATAPPENKGTALTLVNCIGFAISITSIQLLGVPLPEAYLFLLLLPGPMLGTFAMRKFVKSKDGK